MGRVILSGAGRKMTTPKIPISVMPVGSTVKLNVNGVATDFLIVNQGIPSNSSLYDSSCDGTWLLMKDIYENREWNNSSVNNLENSTVLSYLNGPFLNLFDSNIKNAIKQVKIPYRKNGGSGGIDQSGANGLLCKIFPLGGSEVGFTTSDNPYIPVDGAKLSYFESGTGSSALNKRVANLNGVAAGWELRSPVTNGTTHVWYVNSNGDCRTNIASTSDGIRPALILPSTTLVDSNGMVIAPPVEYKANFADNTWAQIIDACHKNKVPATWVVGNSKTMLIDGTEYQIDIIGKNHDDYADGSGKAPLTFQLHDYYGVVYSMNSSHTNVGGWTNCAMRQTHLPAILALMPTEVQSGIRLVNKLTSAGNLSSTINTTTDKLFLLTEIELFGNTTQSFSGEGMQYEYYKAGNSTAKKRNNGESRGWERSPVSNDSRAFCSVRENGQPYTDASANSFGVAFGFCF